MQQNSDEMKPVSGWRRNLNQPSLVEVFHSISPRQGGNWWQRFAAFIGPGYLVSVGYMDPGNWATSIAAGAKFGYALLFVAVLSNFMAIILQSLCARLAIGSGRDLAQACRDAFPKPVVWILWVLAELAIVATDIAEVVGTAIGLNLLFHIPLELGVVITALDVFLVLGLQAYGFRKVEAFIIALLGLIFACFIIQLAMVHPDWAAVIRGIAPTTEVINNPEMLYLAIGIIGATVMPHNLYLHSGIVQTRKIGESLPEKRAALKMVTLDSTIALMLALLINASILIIAAATFHKVGATEISDIGDAHSMLAPLAGSLLAPKLFAIALLACGLNSTITATLAGQIVMEGFINWRLPGWLRRLITRAMAIVPAMIVIFWYGAAGTGTLLVGSQVILALQLPFAAVPLILFTANKRKMGGLVAPYWLIALSSIFAALIIALNVKLIWDML